MEKNFAIIDIETTGGSAKRDKIIEIAIVIFDGEKIIDSFESLVNPQRSIPAYITAITGITDYMVKDAPFFYEIAKKIVQITENCIFVAHNSRFDYGFITEEFKNLGYTYTRKQLDTVKLFRKFFPGLQSYALGNLIKVFDIQTEYRHRAMADVMATLQLLQMGLRNKSSTEILSKYFDIDIKETKLPPNISYMDIKTLPEATGVYYFFDVYDNYVYIGKALNIRKRIKQHFQSVNSKSDKFFNSVRKIKWQITGSELVALLKEAEEIKKYKPHVNKALRKLDFPYNIYLYKDNAGYMNFKISKSYHGQDKIDKAFHNRRSAKAFLSRLISTHQLCKKKSDLESGTGTCFAYSLHYCYGACAGEESPDEYNDRVREALGLLKDLPASTFVIKEYGKDQDEVALVFVEDGEYAGYIFVQKNELEKLDLEEIKQERIKPQYKDEDFISIIKNYLTNKKPDIIIYEYDKNI